MKKTKTSVQRIPDEILRSWEDADGVNYAVALARVTGWLLHVDWWTPTDDKEAMENMRSLRVYVADQTDNIFDVRGKQKITSFNNKIIRPIAQKRGANFGGVVTRYYSEQELFKLPLRVKPDVTRIEKAIEIITNSPFILEKIPVRIKPYIPAHLAANYTFGLCAAYANALADLKGLEVTALIAMRYSDLFGHSKTGYVHSLCTHPDGEGEDSWGKQSVEIIAARFGIEVYILNADEHQRIITMQKLQSPELYNKYYQEAAKLIKTYYLN